MNLEEKIKNLELWFKKKSLMICSFFEVKNKKIFICKKGEIFFAELGTNIGSEMDKSRPVLIFQGNRHDLKFFDTVFVFPITSQMKKSSYKIFFNESENNQNKLEKGGIWVSQGRSISKSRLRQKLGKISPEVLTAVEFKFLQFLGIKKSPLQLLEGGTPTSQKETAKSKSILKDKKA